MSDPKTDALASLKEAQASIDASLVPLQDAITAVNSIDGPLSTALASLAEATKQIQNTVSTLQTMSAPLQSSKDAIANAMTPLSASKTSIASAITSVTAIQVQVPTPTPAPAPVTVVKADTTGKTDVTSTFQAALNKGGTISVPAGTYLIDATVSLKPISNSTIIFDSNAKIVVKPNAEPKYKAILLDSVKNVTITGGQFVGDRDQHNYVKIYLKDGVTLSSLSTHEWGHAVGVYGCDSVTLKNMYFTAFTGDGISVGASNSIRSTNTIIDGVISDNNRRQGLSITNVDGIRVLNSQFINIGVTNGTSPRCGIDIEPDNNTNSADDTDPNSPGNCRNVWIEGCTIKGNAVYGLNVFLRVFDVTVKNNTFDSNISCGAVAVDGTNITFTGNKYIKNGSTGLFVKSGVESFRIEGEEFTLNYMKQNPTLRTTPIVKDGIVSGTSRDLLVNTPANGVVLNNTYN